LLREYTIIQFFAALAIPYTHYKSHWSNSSFSSNFENTIDSSFSKQSLQKIALDLKSLWMNLSRREPVNYYINHRD